MMPRLVIFVLGLALGGVMASPKAKPSEPIVIVVIEEKSSPLEDITAELAERIRWLRLTCNAEELGEKATIDGNPSQ